jgi:multiple sugar transport system permease protein
MLSPLIFFNVIMGIIGSFQIFTQAKVMTNGGPGTDTLFYVLNLYRQAFEFHNMGYASAMAWVLFVIVLVLTALVFRGSKKMVHYEGLKA